jgi:hypothetical protein
MLTLRFVAFHVLFALLLFFVLLLIQKSYIGLLPQSYAILSIVFMSVLNVAAGLYTITLPEKDQKKRIFKAAVIHGIKFILSLFFVLTMLSMEDEKKYAFGIMLASLFLLYMFMEIGMFLYVQKQVKR